VIYGGAGYKILLALHLLSVVIGFGPWFLNGLLPARALGRDASEGKAISGANLQVSTVSQYAIYGVLIFGGAALGAAHKHTVDFGDTFIWLSLILWVAVVGVLHGLVLPAQRELASGSGDRATLTQRQSLGVAAINLLVVVAVVLMVWEPGRTLPF
jgi:hypothetical protein